MAIIDCFYDFEAKRLVALLRALASPSSSQIAGDVRGAFIQGVREALVEKCARIVEHWTPSMWLVDVDKAGIASEIRALAFGDGCPEPSKEKP
jgi:hypothetical protein